MNGLPGRADYSAAKGALEPLAKALAMDVGKYNINVNCVSQGAKLCLFLAWEDSNFITGQNYQVDGGRTFGSR